MTTITNAAPMTDDLTLDCLDCGQLFVFPAGEQHFFRDKHFGVPFRCPTCRAAVKGRRVASRVALETRACRDCGRRFSFAPARWQGRGQKAPGTCPPCRRARREARDARDAHLRTTQEH